MTKTFSRTHNDRSAHTATATINKISSTNLLIRSFSHSLNISVIIRMLRSWYCKSLRKLLKSFANNSTGYKTQTTQYLTTNSTWILPAILTTKSLFSQPVLHCTATLTLSINPMRANIGIGAEDYCVGTNLYMANISSSKIGLCNKNFLNYGTLHHKWARTLQSNS